MAEIDPTAPSRSTTFGRWLVAPTEMTEGELNRLAYLVFSQGNGLRLLEALHWTIMMGTPMDSSGEMAMRDMGKQDVFRMLVHMVHEGAKQPSERSSTNGRDSDAS